MLLGTTKLTTYPSTALEETFHLHLIINPKGTCYRSPISCFQNKTILFQKAANYINDVPKNTHKNNQPLSPVKTIKAQC